MSGRRYGFICSHAQNRPSITIQHLNAENCGHPWALRDDLIPAQQLRRPRFRRCPKPPFELGSNERMQMFSSHRFTISGPSYGRLTVSADPLMPLYLNSRLRLQHRNRLDWVASA